jgi:hypothetical protein
MAADSMTTLFNFPKHQAEWLAAQSLAIMARHTQCRGSCIVYRSWHHLEVRHSSAFFILLEEHLFSSAIAATEWRQETNSTPS